MRMCPSKALSICQLSPSDKGGGAEAVARALFKAYRDEGHQSWLVVGQKTADNPDVFLMPHERAANPWKRFWWRRHFYWLSKEGQDKRAWRRSRRARRLAEPLSIWDKNRGFEDFRYPGTWLLPEILPQTPDVLHAHNLHGDYFDLRALPALSGKIPTVLTLHDAWLLSGHCAHSLGCEKWRTGCGHCPDLSISPGIRRDASAANWGRKKEIFARCRLYVAAPSQWLMHKVENSILLPGIQESRVIPNGVDLKVFCPGNKVESRARLGLPQESRILLFAALGVRRNYWKDFATLRAAVQRIAEMQPSVAAPLLFIALGESAPDEHVGSACIRFVPFVESPSTLADYYRAADLYLHAVRAESFGLVLAEAQACGCPVVATRVGAIPEVVEDGVTGILVPEADAAQMSSDVCHLLKEPQIASQLGTAGAARASSLYGMDRTVKSYLDWYSKISKHRNF